MTKFISAQMSGQTNNGKIVAVLEGPGFTKAEFAFMLQDLQGPARCGNVVDLRTSIKPNRVIITFVLRDGDNSEVLTVMLAEMYLKSWCRDRDDQSRAC